MTANAADARNDATMGRPLAASLALHVVLAAIFLLLRPGPQPPSPPIYRVNIVAAAPGPRAIGVVQPPTPTPIPPEQAATPVRPKTAPTDMPIPSPPTAPLPKPSTATPTLPTETKVDPKAPAPTAAGGETGGRGTDVATVLTEGIEFPYPGYLENIVRQIALRFKPSARGALRAEVAFLIRRDGSVPAESIRLVTRSGVYSFDLEAQGAVEAAANQRAFGALPAGFADDVLPVTFRFDPKLLR
jgi:periplasmic protein TonB